MKIVRGAVERAGSRRRHRRGSQLPFQLGRIKVVLKKLRHADSFLDQEISDENMISQIEPGTMRIHPGVVPPELPNGILIAKVRTLRQIVRVSL